VGARRDLRYGLTFISPAILFFLLFWILPVILAVGYSLTDWTVGRSASFIGLENYVDLFTDPRFHQSLLATLKITLPSLIGTCGLAFGLALLLNDDKLRGRRVIMLIVILPFVTDWVATGLVWQLIYLPNSGVLAGIFSQLGVHKWMSLRWTTSRQLAPLAIAMFTIWKTTGLYAIIFLAGLKGVPSSQIEAAQVDGANFWQSLFFVTLPLMRPIVVFVLVSAFVSIVGFFEPVFMLTGGGPADATRTLPIFLYENFFQFHNGGAASAAGIVFLLLCLGFALVAARFLQYSYYE
jgi:ABC-type sugar transport system permease subunit